MNHNDHNLLPKNKKLTLGCLISKTHSHTHTPIFWIYEDLGLCHAHTILYNPESHLWVHFSSSSFVRHEKYLLPLLVVTWKQWSCPTILRWSGFISISDDVRSTECIMTEFVRRDSWDLAERIRELITDLKVKRQNYSRTNNFKALQRLSELLEDFSANSFPQDLFSKHIRVQAWNRQTSLSIVRGIPSYLPLFTISCLI